MGAQVVAGIRPLGHMFLQQGVIDIDVLSQSLARMAETRRPQGEILVEMGAVSREQVDQALADQQSGYFGLIAAMEKGAYRFDGTESLPSWAAQSHLSSLRTIVDALERPQAGALVISALQPVASGPLRLSSGYPAVVSAFRWSRAEEALISRLQTPATLEALFAPSGVAPERARAMVAALLLLGLAVSAKDGARPSGESVVGLELEVGSRRRGPGPSGRPPRVRPHPRHRLRRRGGAIPPRPGLGGSACSTRPCETWASAPSPGPARTPPASAAAAQPGSSGATPPPRAVPGSVEAQLRKSLLMVAPRAREKDLFARLGLTPGAGREEVKQAFLSMARQFHPDRFAAPALSDMAEVVKEFFTAVNEAYETLSDDRRRNAYMAQRSEPGAAQAEAARMDYVKGEACLRTRDFGRARGFYEAAVRADPAPSTRPRSPCQSSPTLPPRSEIGRGRCRTRRSRTPPADGRPSWQGSSPATTGTTPGRRSIPAALALDPRNADVVRELRMIERKRTR